MSLSGGIIPGAPPGAGAAPRRSIRTVLMGVVLACLLPGLIGATALIVHTYQEWRGELEAETLHTARALIQTVDGQLLQARAIGETLATDEALARGDFPGFRQRALAVLERTRVGANITVIDRSFQQQVNLLQQPGRTLPSAPYREPIQRVFEGGRAVISDLFIAPLIKRPVISVYVPVMNGDQVAHVISVGFRAEQFSSILHSQKFPTEWVAAIFDSSGTIVARTQAEDQFVGQKGTAEYIERIRQGQEGAMATITREGIPVFSTFSRSPVTGYSVGIGIPQTSLRAGLLQPLSLLMAGVAALFVVGIGLAWFMGGRIARSVRALTPPALALGTGRTAPPRAIHIREAAQVAAAMERAGQLLNDRTLALKESQARFQATFEQAAVGIAHVALNGTWLRVNDRLCAMLGYEREELLALTFQNITCAEDLAADLAHARELLAGRIPNYSLEKRYIRKDGSLLWAYLTGSVVRRADGSPDYCIAVIEDIQRRKEAEAALEAAGEAHRQHLEQQVAERTAALLEAQACLEHRVDERTREVRRLAAEATYAEERERQALARDLHDDLGQLLHVLRLKMGLLGKETLSDQGRSLVQQSAALIGDASRQVRSLTSQLSPPTLSTLGLPAALRWLCEEIQTTYNLRVACHAEPPAGRLSPAQATILFRAARELLINVSKHSGSNTAVLRLASADGVLTMAVEDSGRGFTALEEALAGKRGFGLANVRERIAFLGGDMDIQTPAGGGVRIILRMPMAAEESSTEVE